MSPFSIFPDEECAASNPYEIGTTLPYDPSYQEVKNMVYLVAYDICAPSRLRHAAKVCEDFGVRVEKSVFECDLEEADFARFWARLFDCIDEGEDRLISYAICKSCVKKIQSAGLVVRPERPLAYIF